MPFSAGSKVLGRVAYGLLTSAIMLALVEGVLALAGVRPVAYERDPYVGFSSQMPLFVRQGDRWVTADNKLEYFNPQSFAAQKPDGTVRIFCLGGSTTYGRPYDDRTSFAGWMRTALPALDGSKQWEVINAGGVSYASYRVALVMEELLRHEPDVFVVYTGQNEFLERRTYGGVLRQPPFVRAVGSVASRTRVYALIARAMGSGAAGPRAGDGRFELTPEVEALLDSSVGPQAYTRDEELVSQVEQHFRLNLRRMIAMARSAGAQIVFVTPASNLGACSPFKSEFQATVSATDRERVGALLLRARELRATDAVASLELLDEALVLDGRYAATLYERASTLLALEEFEQARVQFSRARDEDVCPLRAVSALVDAVRESADGPGVALVDFERVLESVASHGILGEDEFLDHVHPTIDQHRRLAEAIVGSLKRLEVVRPQTPPTFPASVVADVMGGLDPRDHAVALRNLAKVMNWAGKTDEAQRLAERATELLPDDVDALNELGVMAYERGEYEQAETHLRRAVESAPGFAKARANLALVLVAQGNLVEAERECRRALDDRPADVKLRTNLANVLGMQGKMSDAEGEYQRAIELSPQDATVHHNLGNLYAKQDRLADAEQSLRRALDLQPRYAQAHYSLAVALARQGMFDDAESHARTALEIQPDYAAADGLMAQIERARP